MSDSMDELRRLEAEATPGPWGPVVDHDQDEWWIYAFGAGPTLVPYVPDGPNFARSEADAALIVAMRNALPELLAAESSAAQALREREVLEGAVRRVNEIHKPETQEMVDLDGGPEGEDVPIDVNVCADCWHRVYPEGCDDEYVDPDVFWPCPTARAASLPSPEPTQQEDG